MQSQGYCKDIHITDQIPRKIETRDSRKQSYIVEHVLFFSFFLSRFFHLFPASCNKDFDIFTEEKNYWRQALPSMRPTMPISF